MNKIFARIYTTNELDLEKAADVEMSIVSPDDTTQQLITLLTVKHLINHDQ